MNVFYLRQINRFIIVRKSTDPSVCVRFNRWMLPMRCLIEMFLIWGKLNGLFREINLNFVNFTNGRYLRFSMKRRKNFSINALKFLSLSALIFTIGQSGVFLCRLRICLGLTEFRRWKTTKFSCMASFFIFSMQFTAWNCSGKLQQ